MLRVGQAELRGDLKRYARHFQLLEVAAEPGKLPKLKRLAGWAAERPLELEFALRVGPKTWALADAAWMDMVAAWQRAAECLSAAWLVVATPPDARPTRVTRQQLVARCAPLRGFGPRLGWEPYGLWEQQQAETWAGELDVDLVVDPSHWSLPDAPRVYCRLRALGGRSQVSLSKVEQLAQDLLGYQEAHVVVEGRGAARAAQLLRELVTE